MKTSKAFSNKEVISQSDVYLLYSGIMKDLLTYYMVHLETYGHVLPHQSLGISEDSESLSDNVDKCYTFHMSATDPSNHGDNFKQEIFEIEFEVHLSVLCVKGQWLLMIDLVQLPQWLRGKGLFTGIVKKLKDFMDKYGLGDVVGMSDSSFEGESSRVLEKFGLSGDPFMEDRYGIGVGFENV